MDNTDAYSLSKLSDSDFDHIVQFVSTRYGIDLSQKRRLVEARLGGEIKKLGLNSYKQYVDMLDSDSGADKLDTFINKITTNYSFFNREMDHYNFLMNNIIPAHAQAQKTSINIWSAGCATGEEPYNISMALDSALGANRNAWNISITATDISKQALTAARKGEYPETELKGMPEEWKNEYMTELPDGNYRVNENIRRSVFFSKLNLMEPFPHRKYDVIFCRNVMIYFKQATSQAILKKFNACLSEGGYLFIGHSETISGIMSDYKYVRPSIYQKVTQK